jgi:septum formation protein
VAQRLILASGSPRRASLLREAGFEFEVRPAGVAEWPYGGGSAAAYAESLARAKAGAVPPGGDGVVLGADTVVVLDGEVLGKPRDAEEAAAMLRLLSGRRHEVITAVALERDGAVRCAHDRAEVTFRSLGAEEIARYVASGEPLDKAGAYAIQGGAADFVTRLEGSRDTVVGLPVQLVRALLAD